MTDVVAQLTRVFRGAVPPDVTSTAFALDIVTSLAETMALAESEVQRLAAGAKISTATGAFVDAHLRDHGLRRQNGETDAQAKTRLQRPPQAVTKQSIIDAVAEIIGGVHASLDLAPLTTNVETVIEAIEYGTAGNLLQFQTVATGTGAGQLEETSVLTRFKYQSGVTTVANFETALLNSDNIRVKTSDAVGTMTSPGDTVGATSLTGGTDPQAYLIELPRDGAYFDRYSFFDRDFRMGGSRGVVIVLIPQSANAVASVTDALRNKVAAGKLWLVQEYT